MHFFRQRNVFQRIARQAGPVEFRQVEDHFLRLFRLAAHHQGAQAVQRVEQEVRIDLIAQRAQLRVLRGLGEAGGLALDLADLSGIAERQVERGPADDEEKARGGVFRDCLQCQIFLSHIFAHFLDMRLVPQVLRIIDVENQMVERGDDERAGDCGGKGGDDPGRQRLFLELSEDEIEKIGDADAENRYDNAPHRHFALRRPVADRGPQRQHDDVEQPEPEYRQNGDLMADRRLVISQFKFSHKYVQFTISRQLRTIWYQLSLGES